MGKVWLAIGSCKSCLALKPSPSHIPSGPHQPPGSNHAHCQCYPWVWSPTVRPLTGLHYLQTTNSHPRNLFAFLWLMLMFQDGLLRARGPSSGPFISGFKTPNSHCPFCRMILTPLSLCAHPLLSSSPPYFLKFYLLLRSPSVSLTSFLFLTSSLCIFPHLPSPSPSPSPSLIPPISFLLPAPSVCLLHLLPLSHSPPLLSLTLLFLLSSLGCGLPGFMEQ